MLYEVITSCPSIFRNTDPSFFPYLARQPLLIAGDSAAFTTGQIFDGMKTKASNIADRTDSASLIEGATCMRRIFHNLNPFGKRQFSDGIHITWVSCQMDNNDRFRLFCNFPFNVGYRNIHRIFLDIGKDRRRITSYNVCYTKLLRREILRHANGCNSS